MKIVSDYKEIIEQNPKIAEFLDADTYEYMSGANKKTQGALSPLWEKNFKDNLDLLEKHGLVNDGCRGIGNNKAVIMIGAGPSLKRHTERLKNLCHWNAQFEVKDQPFLFMCSNHQFKPYAKEGIVPHFVVLVDASESEAVYKQLCVDIPLRARRCVLVCSLYANPKITHRWDKNGGLIQFYSPLGDGITDKVESLKGKEIIQGGNVMNTAWVIAYSLMVSRVFIAVGNDLSYGITDDDDDRRKGYYADGDYSSNLASGRDEAKKQFKWMGFEFRDNPFEKGSIIDFKPRSTVHSLYSYKNWLEINIGLQGSHHKSFHYYNCSEEGILGVVAKDKSKTSLEDKDNWILLDEVFPEHYHTTSLQDATSHFIMMRKLWETRMGIRTSAESAIVLPGQTVGVPGIGLPRSGSTPSGIIL